MIRKFSAKAFSGDDSETREEEVALESSITLSINREYRINLVASPQQLEDLAVGYLISEGFITNTGQIQELKVSAGQIQVEVGEGAGEAKLLFEIRSSGCVGFKMQFDDLRETIQSDLAVPVNVLCAMQEMLPEQSKVWRATGGCHVAGIYAPDGTLLHSAEDVGRHNALDKAIGMAARVGRDFGQLVAATSGRLAGGMVAKVARAGFPIFLSKAAPLDAGITLAQRVGLTLCGFVRGKRLTAYTHPRRVLPNAK